MGVASSKMWGGQQAEPVKRGLEAEPQRGPGAPGQRFKLPEVERCLYIHRSGETSPRLGMCYGTFVLQLARNTCPPQSTP